MFKKPIFELLVNFLLGISWAIALIGAIFAFDTFYNFGFITAIIASIIGSLTGFIFVVILEFINLNINNYKESLKQTKLLEEISSEIKKLSNN